MEVGPIYVQCMPKNAIKWPKNSMKGPIIYYVLLLVVNWGQPILYLTLCLTSSCLIVKFSQIFFCTDTGDVDV